MMDSPKITYKYYSNPAFCAQSEVVYTQQSPCVSTRIISSPSKRTITTETKRVPPLGANSPIKIKPIEYDRSGNQRLRTDISDNPLRINKSHSKSASELPPKPGPKPKYAIISPDVQNSKKSFSRSASQRAISSKNEYVTNHRRVNSMRSHRIEEELEMFQVVNKTCPADLNNIEDETNVSTNHSNYRVLKHRYAELPNDYDDYCPSKKRIIETEPEEYNVDASSEDEVKEVPVEIVRTVHGKIHRYAIIPSEDEEETMEDTVIERSPSPPTFYLTSPNLSRKKIEATQKLHELLATPRKTPSRTATGTPLKSCISTPSIRAQLQSPNRVLSPEKAGFPGSPSKVIISSTPKQNAITSSKSCNNLTSPPLPRRNPKSPISPKAQQKLNYDANSTIDTMNSTIRKPCPDFFVKEASFVKSRENSFVKTRDLDRSYEMDKSKDSIEKSKYMVHRKSTAVISPRLASRGDESIYSSGTVFSGKTWNVNPGCATLALAATMMSLSGALSAALSFYIMCMFGRRYYLDVGVLSGFICLMLGMLGFRSRTYQLLPNRNYVSGYIVLSVFSLMSCALLLTLLIFGDAVMLGGTTTDLIGGAVSGLGALCLLMACGGALASCCCTRTPPDNRVMGA